MDLFSIRTPQFLTWTLTLSPQRGTQMAGEKTVALDQVLILSFQWTGQSFQMFLNVYSSNKFKVTWYFWELLQVLPKRNVRKHFYPFFLSALTDGDVTVDSLSPNHTLSSVSSPASVEPHSPCSTHVSQTPPQNKYAVL